MYLLGKIVFSKAGKGLHILPIENRRRYSLWFKEASNSMPAEVIPLMPILRVGEDYPVVILTILNEFVLNDNLIGIELKLGTYPNTLASFIIEGYMGK